MKHFIHFKIKSDSYSKEILSYFRNSQNEAPVIPNRINTNVTMSTNIGMKYLCDETNYRWFHRITENAFQI